jgi:hypothetical protein
MSDMLAIILILVLLGCAYPALLGTLKVLFPRPVASSQARIERQPWRCFWTGLVAAVAIALPAIILINLPLGLLKFMGWSLIGLGLGLSVFGAAGLAGLMASRMQLNPPSAPAEFGAFMRAAVMIELAAIFPLLGWLAFFPISLLISLGAALLTWLRGAPAPEKGARPELVQAGTGAQA